MDKVVLELHLLLVLVAVLSGNLIILIGNSVTAALNEPSVQENLLLCTSKSLDCLK